MKRIGLTGSIGAGKSAATDFLRAQGIAVHDADAAVHQIYTWPEMIVWLAHHFPEAMASGTLDRQKLGEIVYNDPARKKKLESFVHPAVATSRTAFIVTAKTHGEMIVVCDIPLLFETGIQQEFTETWLITTPDDIRRARVMARPGMTAEKFARIDAAQMPQTEKAKLATHVISNDGTLEQLHEKLSCLIGQK